MTLSRRRWLKAALGAASALPFYLASQRNARSDSRGRARRVIFFYFPDGIAGRSQAGDAGLWEPRMSGGDIQLSEILAPLGDLKRECVFLNGLSMGGTDEGSHPGGAKKLLTARDGGNGESIDQFLARTVGRGAPFRHVYLGAMATHNNASGDKFISYPSAGVTVAPDDDPVRAFRRLFASGTTAMPPVMGMTPPMTTADDEAPRLALETALADLQDLRGSLGQSERVKLDVHLESLREVQGQVAAMSTTRPPAATDAGAMMPSARCDSPTLGFEPPTGDGLFAPENFPAVLRAQTDTMVLAMACGLTQVGVIQCSQHTSELIMSRFRDTEMYDPGFDMRSHQASHYGPKHDRGNRLFRDFLSQRRWFVAQFTYLLEQLKARPEGDGTMLDYSLVLLCSEVCDGNTHSHDNLPFVLAGRGGGKVRTGRLLQYGNRRHADLLLSIAQAMGQSISHFGQGSSGPLPGLLG